MEIIKTSKRKAYFSVEKASLLKTYKNQLGKKKIMLQEKRLERGRFKWPIFFNFK